MTLEVYGHLVATDVFGNGYVIPIHETLEDIKRRLDVESVTLLSSIDVVNTLVRNKEVETVIPTSSSGPGSGLVSHPFDDTRTDHAYRVLTKLYTD